jgi:histidinol-phosphate/aromatic aminotransferase/cobyric acid decarboxylase-like protein
LGLGPLPSFTNFVLVPDERAQELYEALLDRGFAVRPSPGALRITVHRPEANDRLLEALASLG